MNKKTYEKLFEIRKNSKLSRRKLSDLSGFKEPTIVGYEKGLRKPSEEYIRFISLYFNVLEEYIKGLNEQKEEYTPLKRVFLMYQDIYSYSDSEMANLLDFKNNTEMYQKLLKEDVYNVKNRGICVILESLEYLNIKPSCVGLTLPSIEPKEPNLERLEKKLDKNAIDEHLKQNQEYFEERKALFDKRIVILEKKGINLNVEYYAENIKRRNLAKKNYTPPKEVKELPKKYQAIVDLFPYASDKFLNDIYSRLKTMKEIQSI